MDQFVEYACQGAGLYAAQTAALGAVRGVATTIDTLTAPASSDLGTVIGSIAKYSQKVDGIPAIDASKELESNTMTTCRKQTATDLETFAPKSPATVAVVGQGRGLDEISGAVTTIKELGSALEALGVWSRSVMVYF